MPSFKRPKRTTVRPSCTNLLRKVFPSRNPKRPKKRNCSHCHAHSSVERTEDRHIPFLPPEILSRVCAFLPLSALKSTRLASKLLESCASRFLFETIYIEILPESFERLLAIFAEPKFASGVRSVYLDTRVFGSLPSLGGFKAEYGYRCEGWRTGGTLPQFSLTETAPRLEDISDGAWREYHESHCAIVKSQWQPEQYSTVDSVLLQAIRRFPSLENVFVDHLCDLPAFADNPSLVHSRTMTRTIERVLFPPTYDRYRRPRHPVSVLTAAGLVGIKLRHIHLARLGGRFFDLPILEHNDPLQSSLASVQCLRMEVYQFRNPDDAWSGNLESFIEQCRDLRCPELLVYDEGHIPSRMLQKEWPAIRTICVRQMALAEDDLINFICTHKSSLSAVLLSECPLVVGEWSSVTTRLKQLFDGYQVKAEDEQHFELKRDLLSFILIRHHDCDDHDD